MSSSWRKSPEDLETWHVLHPVPAFHPTASQALPSCSARLGANVFALAGAFRLRSKPCLAAGQVGHAEQAAQTLPKEFWEQMKCPNKTIRPKCISQKGPYRWSSQTSPSLCTVLESSALFNSLG